MYTYKIIKFGSANPFCILRSDDVSIPLDLGNSDYQKYLKWIDGYEYIDGQWVKTSDGNTPLTDDE
jgi:hypothetical protein